MRYKAKITFHLEPTKVSLMLRHLGFKEIEDDTMQVVNVYTDVKEYLILLDVLQNNGIQYSEKTSVVYSKKDLDEAELLVMAPYHYCGYPQPEEDNGYKEYSYDMDSVCPTCSQGAVQNNYLRVKKLKMEKYQISALHWLYEFVVTEELKKLLEKSNLSGFEFWPLIDYKRGIEYEGFFQLKVNGTMPSMNSETLIVPAKHVNSCECRKRGYILEGQIKYDRKVIDSIKDFNKTEEWLGGGKTTWQKIIVTKKVYELFVKEKIKGIQFYPIIIID